MHLYEGLESRYIRNARLWESAGRKLTEAQLTTNQINQLFAAVASGAAASGSNRTMLGKGVDAASAVNKAWEDLKTKVQNSGPIQNIDAMYDQAAEKLKQATGGDAGVMKYVQKYRDFAKAHPVAQSFIYAALIAAAGISGAGAGGAAALGLFKMADKLLQGEKFSSAAYSGAKTGAAAYAAGQIAQNLKGGEMTPNQTTSAADATAPVSQTTQQTVVDYPTTNLSGISGEQIVSNPAYKQAYADYMSKFGNGNNSAFTIQAAKKYATAAAKQAIARSTNTESINHFIDFKLTESVTVFAESIGASVSGVILTEAGVGQALKGAANWMKTKAGNLTNKVTADKLRQQWVKDGSNPDSNAVAQSMQKAGAEPDAIKQGMTSVGVTDFNPAALNAQTRVEPTFGTDPAQPAVAQPNTQDPATPATATPAEPEPAADTTSSTPPTAATQQQTAQPAQTDTAAPPSTSQPAAQQATTGGLDYRTVVKTVTHMDQGDIDEIKRALDSALAGMSQQNNLRQQDINTAGQQQPPAGQQQNGQAVDLEQLRLRREKELAQGQAEQRLAIQQMQQTAAADAAKARDEANVLATAKAAKAKPGFQQTASDRLAIQQARQRGLMRDSKQPQRKMMERSLRQIRNSLVENYIRMKYAK